MNALDRILEEVAALRERMVADRTTLRLGTFEADGRVLLGDGARVTPAAVTGSPTTGARVIVAQHGRRAYVLGVVA